MHRGVLWRATVRTTFHFLLVMLLLSKYIIESEIIRELLF
jgi:hypothetical protein